MELLLANLMVIPFDAMGISLNSIIPIYKFLWTYGGFWHIYMPVAPWLAKGGNA